MYTPSDAISIPEDTIIRLALQSAPGKGKTWSALTFPYPLVLNFDNNLQAFAGRKDIQQVPFYDDTFVDKLMPRTKLKNNQPTPRPNRKDAILKWLEEHAAKMEDDQTLILDSWSRVQDGFDAQAEAIPIRTASGDVDGFAFWKDKQIFSRQVCEILGTLKCNVVVTFHEQFETDDAGKILFNKVKPLQQGKFMNKLPSYFSDWFRCLFFAKGTDLSKETQLHPLLKEMGEKVVLENDLGLWQTKSDLVSDCKSRIPGCPQFIRAHYGNLIDLYAKSQQAKNNLSPAT